MYHIKEKNQNKKQPILDCFLFFLLSSCAFVSFQTQVEEDYARYHEKHAKEWSNSTKPHWDASSSSQEGQWKVVEASDWDDESEKSCQPFCIDVDRVVCNFFASVCENIEKFKIFNSVNAYACT